MIDNFKQPHSKEYNRMNLQLDYIEDLASLIDLCYTSLKNASMGSVSSHRKLYGHLVCLEEAIVGVDLNVSKENKKRLDLYLNIGNKLIDYNLEKSLEYLRKAFRLMLYLLKTNNLIFAKKSRSHGFKGFVEQELN